MPEVTITLKQSGGHDAPWVAIKAETPAEALLALNEFVTVEGFETVKLAAQRFKATVSYSSGPPAAPPASPAKNDEADLDKAEAALKAAGMSREARDATLSNQALPESVHPKCPKCGKPGEWKEGVSAKGTAYSGYFCLADDWEPCK